MIFTVLASGSKGNAIVVQSGETAVLVEAGLSPKMLKQRMGDAGLDPRRLSALVVTHGHSDHVASAPETAEALHIPTFATASCAAARARAGRPLYSHQALPAGEAVPFGPLTLRAFRTPHDAPGSIGLVFEDATSRVAMVTDLGCATTEVTRAIQDVNLLYLEFNHDVEMLLNGPYPRVLKNRVRSNMGHLSNGQGAELLGQVRGPSLRTVVLAHLSEQNNTSELAVAAARTVLDGSGIGLHVAPQREPLPSILVGGPRRAVPVAPLPEPPKVAPDLPTRTPGGKKIGAGARAQLSLFAAPGGTRGTKE